MKHLTSSPLSFNFHLLGAWEAKPWDQPPGSGLLPEDQHTGHKSRTKLSDKHLRVAQFSFPCLHSLFHGQSDVNPGFLVCHSDRLLSNVLEGRDRISRAESLSTRVAAPGLNGPSSCPLTPPRLATACRACFLILSSSALS